MFYGLPVNPVTFLISMGVIFLAYFIEYRKKQQQKQQGDYIEA